MAEIAADPELRREVEAVLPRLLDRAKPAGDDAVRRALQPLVLVYGVGEAARVAAFWAPYRILASVPALALAKGIEDYTSAPDSNFFPKPGPLKALCDRHAEPMLKAASRAKRALEEPAKPPQREESEAERAAVRNMLADFKSKMEAKRASATKPRVEPPSISGKPDEGGLTPQMRAILARQNGDHQ